MKKSLRYILGLVLAFMLSVPSVEAYERYATTTSGVDFWLTFLNNNGVAASDKSLMLKVILSATEACDVNIDVNGQTVQTIGLGANSTATYQFEDNELVYASETETAESKGVHVYAVDGKTNFSCFTYTSVGEESSPLRDMSLVLPSASLGREYMVQTYDDDFKSTEFAIVAAENTVVSIYPSVKTEKGADPDSPITNISLKKGEVYWVSSIGKGKAEGRSIDLSGSRICSTHPIAVFVGNQATRITPPATAFSENHAYEQILPVMWQGREYYFTLTGNAYNKQNVVKFTSIYDQTNVTIQSPGLNTDNHSFSEELGEGESDYITLNPENDFSEVIIKADSPIVMMAYMACGGYSQHAYPKPEKPTQSVTIAWGNPASAMIPAWNQRVKSMDFVIPEIQSTYPNFVEYYLQLVTTTASTSAISLDGAPVDASLWRYFAGDPSMSHANIPIQSVGRHLVSSTKDGFVGTISGQADGQAYMYTLGYAPRPLRDSLYRDGEYMHQFPDFPIGEERLDTAYVCDSTELNFMGKLAGDMAFDSLVWQVYRVDTLTHSRELDSTEVVLNTADRQHDWKYLFALDPLKDLEPAERPAYQFYEVDLLLYRTPLICEMAEPEVDTLQTMVHVARMYNDTILQRVICAGDSAACFLDAGHEDAEGYWVLSDDSADDKPTQFVGEDVAEDQYHTQYAKGDNYYTRKYHTIYGCDSTMIFYLHVCDTFRTVIDTTVCTNDTLFFDTDHFNRKRFPKGLHEWGVYFDTLKTTQCDEYKLIDPTFMGCDSIFELHLDTCSSYLFDTVATLCTNGKVKFHWRKYDIDETDPHMIPHYVGSRISYWTGVFYDSLTTENICDHCAKECDSVYRLTLTIPNHYEYHAQAASYCDSIYQNAGTTYTFTRYTGYNWSGHTKDADGQPRTLWIREINGVEKDSMITADRLTYLPFGQYMIHDSLKSQYDCDSVWILPLTVGHTFFRHERYEISDNVPFTWVGHKGAGGKDRTYGPYYGEADSTRHFDHDNQESKLTGCDSIYRLELVIAKHFEELTYDTICQDSTYTWAHVSQTQTYTRTYSAPGTYHLWDSLKTVTLPIKDSIYHHQLLVKPKYRILVHKSICDCQTKYDFNGHILNDTVYRWKTDDEHELVIKDSIHLDTRTPGLACDSFVTLYLHVWRSYELVDTVHVCQDPEAPMQDWHGQPYSIRVADTLRLQDLQKTRRGMACDSNYYHTIVVDPSYRVEVKDTICQTALPYPWEDHFDAEGNPLLFYSDTVFVDTLHTHGCHVCDSVVTLRLKVMDDTNRSHKVALCKNDEVYYDPIIQMYFNPQMDSMTVGLHTYYPLVHTAEYACLYYDTLYLQINPTYMLPVEYDTVCQYSTDTVYTWYSMDPQGISRAHSLNNISTRHAGNFTYIDSLKTISGCDSIHTLQLHIDSVYHITDPMVKISDEESYVWRGQFYAGPEYARLHPDQMPDTAIVCGLNYNYYQHYYEASTTCDSTHYLTLRVGKVFRDTAYAVICAGDTYDWHITSPITGQETVFPNLTGKPGETVLYYDSLQTSLDFDSIYVLKLYQLPDYHYATTTDTVCEGSGAMGAFYDWTDHAGPDHHLSINGVPTTVFPTDTFGLFILRDSLETKESFLVRASGERTYTTYAPSCDSIYTLSLYIAPVYNATYNKIVDTITICDNDSYTWQGRTYRGADYPADGDKPKRYVDVDLYKDTTVLGKTCMKIKDCADSIRFLTLKVLPTDYVELPDQKICNSEDFAFGEKKNPRGDYHFEWDHSFVLPAGQIRDSVLVLYDTVHNRYDCDSVTRIQLTVHPTYMLPVEYDTVCQYSTDTVYTWYSTDPMGNKQAHLLNISTRHSGDFVYIDSQKTISGCDSIHTLQLHIDSVYHITDPMVKMSDEESYVWRGQFYAGPEYARLHPDQMPDTAIVCGLNYNYYKHYYEASTTCDSTHYLTLRVGKVFRDTAYAVICAGDTYDWHITSPITGQETVFQNLAGKPGETVLYYDSLQTSLDFDSIYVLKLYQLPDYHFAATTDTVCEGSGAMGAFYDWTDHAGPDHHLSINGIPTTVFPTDTFGLFILRDSLKTKESFSVRASGEKTFTTYTSACDSIYTLSLYIAPVYNATYNKIVDTITICDNDSDTWQGRTYRGADYPADGDKPKRYVDVDLYKDTTALGKTCMKIKDCADSIRFLTLKVMPTSYVEKKQTICNNDEFSFGEADGPHGDHHFVWRNQFVLPVGQVRDTTITLFDTVHNVYACDSVTKMTLTVHPSYHILTDTMVCASELVDFVWRGRTGYLVDVDDYDYQYTKTFGCDSTFHLHLTVIPNILEEQTIDYCEGDTMVWRGQRIHASFVTPTQPDYEQTYRAKYTTQQGCEAEAILHVRFHHIYHTIEQHEACDTEDYIFVGRRYRLAFWRSALQKDTVVRLDTLVHSVYGCDSAVTHYLTIHPSYAFRENRTICSDESVTIQGRTYHSDVATTLLDTVHYSTIYDCDSIYYISVRVNQSYHWTDDQERCAQDLNFDWYGIQVRHSAEEVAKWHNDTILYYTDDHHTIHNCDSTYHLTILAHPVRYEERTDSICEGDYYVSPSHRVWRKEGTYYDTTFTALGCPIYHTIHLRVLQPTSYSFKIAPVCANDPVALLYYEYQGEKPLSYSLLFDDMAHDQLFYDQQEIPLDPHLNYLTLEMPPRSTDPMQYPRPARYAVQVMMDNGVCRDSSLLLFPVTLEVRYPDWIIEQHWNDAIGILVPELNGRDVVTGTGYSFSSYQWYRNDSILYGETRPFLFAPHYLMAGAKYSVELTREGETEAIRTCDIVAHNHAVDHVVPTQPFMSVTPLVVDHRHPEVNIIASEPGSYILYTSYGVRLKSGAYIPDEHLAATVELPILSGVYVFELTSQSGMHRSVKVIVE